MNVGEIIILFIVFVLALFLSQINYWRRFEQKNQNKIDPEEVLEKYFPFFRALNRKNKQVFLKRLQIFMQKKEFVSRLTKPNQKVHLLIGASAIQLSFGWPEYDLASFKKILVYPDKYFNKITENHHHGEVNVDLKLIVISTQNFLFGIRDEEDGIHLAIHEFAHAFLIQFANDKNRHFLRNFDEWKEEAEKVMEIIKQQKQIFFREYASTNIQEMFAICAENFFERPAEFKNQFSTFFELTLRLYNQNPLNEKSPIVNSF